VISPKILTVSRDGNKLKIPKLNNGIIGYHVYIDLSKFHICSLSSINKNKMNVKHA
jgi:hypothetical protein